jgi:CelD/BcsL family acetyltransferase involved in cellulose biosynthesis
MPMPAWVDYGFLGASSRARPQAGYSVTFAGETDEMEAALRSAGGLAALPFQHRLWLEAWFATAGRQAHIRPLIATIRDEARDQLAMLLPLVELREKGRRIVEFADLGITDYNAPLLGPAAPRCAESAESLWEALIRELPEVDAIRLTKMPGEIGGQPNPLALLSSSRRSHLHGNVVSAPSFGEFKSARGRARRKEVERSWRVFRRLGGTEFRRARDVTEALDILGCMERQQRRRIESLGLPYLLDTPPIAAFYRKLVAEGFASGYAVVTALRAEGEVVAALLGIRSGSRFTVLRISNAGDFWKPSSPGRLVITHTMQELCAEGCTSFDFTTGDYEFKRRLGAERGDLFELTLARSWLGLPIIAKAAVKAQMRRYPELAGRVRRLLRGKAGGAGLMMARS